MAGETHNVSTASAYVDALPFLMTPTTPPPGFAELYERHYAAVFHAALRVTGNPADAEDVLQTVFLRVLTGLTAVRPQSDRSQTAGLTPAYFRRAAVNAAVDV